MVISQLTTKQDAFNKVVETLEKYQTEILPKLDLEIETKKAELQDLTEHKHTAAVEYLLTVNEIPIKKEELEKLQVGNEERSY